MKNNEKNIPVNIQVSFSDEKDLPPLNVYVFRGNGALLAHAPLEKRTLSLELPVNLNGQHVELVIAPSIENEKITPSLDSLKRMGGFNIRKRFLVERPVIELAVPPYIFPKFCICLVKGRLVKRFTLPNGIVTERPVCHARVHICEVDTWRLFVPKIPDLDIYRLRDDMLDKLRVIPKPFPPEPLLPIIETLPRAGLKIAANLNDRTLSYAINNDQQRLLLALASSDSTAQIRQSLLDFPLVILPYICGLTYLWRYFVTHCVSLTNVDAQGRFSAYIGHRCSDQPDIYFWVEQIINGVWQTIYRPGYACGTHWNYVCGTEVVINLPNARACEIPGYDLPEGVGSFVLPWSIGDTYIWGKPVALPSPGPAPAPFGWVRDDGFVDYSSALGNLFDAPFGGVLNFRQDDSYFIPSAAIKYYRYSYRKYSPVANTGPNDSSWAAIATPLARTYRLEYSDRLPSYESYPVGPVTSGMQSNLFEFKPQVPPSRLTDPATVLAREWITGPVNDVAASWNTLEAAPPLSLENISDDAGKYQIKIEVFDENGDQVIPGSGFNFLLLNADQVSTRLASFFELSDGAYIMDVQLDNNPVSAALPQPSIGGISASDNCGFLRYQASDSVRIAFQATHPNNRAVFRFAVKRGSNTLVAATTAAPYIETGSASALPYVKAAGFYQHGFSPNDLVGACVNAAFAANLHVYGKATNGTNRLEYDASRLIAFALATNGY